MKKIQLFKIACAALILMTISCKNTDAAPADAAATKPAFDMAAAKTTIEAGYTEFETAFNAKDAAGLANCYTTDAKLMGPNEKAVEGKAGIQKMVEEWFKGETPKINLTLVDVWGDENLVVAENAWEMTMDGKVIDSGKSIEVYKMEGEKWRLFRDCYNSDMPAMPMK